MERIMLFSLETEYIKNVMEMHFNNAGKLIFDGQDIGKRVEEGWGDSDYEYTFIIEP